MLLDRGVATQREVPIATSSCTGNGLVQELAVILDVLRGRGAATKPVVARETGFSRAVVAQRLSDLQAAGLIVESGSEVSSGGRPPRQIQFNANLGHVLVADLDATSIGVAVADLRGTVLVHRAEDADIAAGPEVILGRVEQFFDEIAQVFGDAISRLWGIGVGVPGPIEFSTGRPVTPPIMPDWDNYPVRERLSTR